MKPLYPVLFLIAAGTLCYAGDILRGGAPANQRNPALGNPATSAAADAARSNARDMLSRTTQAVDSVRNMQNAARNLAVKGVNNLGADPNHPGQQLPVVQDGLHPNGLNFSKVVSGANAPTQTIANGRANVTVKQTAQQAFLEWNKFNVGRGTTLYFDQKAGGSTAGQWIAFNQVKDPSGEPSQIMGQIKAQGQVYIINANGIIFGGTSQVNVHALVAATLPINKSLLERGLLNNPKAEFLFSGLQQSSDPNKPSPFGPDVSYLPGGRIGNVEVQAGAQLTAPTNADHVGGRIALIGANVTNAGRIFTPDGQTILAAGLEVGMAAHSSKDPSLRGLDVYVGQVGTYSGTVTNTGIVDAPRGNITLTGKTLNQLGILTASTSVSLNGRIDLNASYDAVTNTKYDPTNNALGAPFLYKSAGTITLGVGSVTRILPEVSSTDKVVGTKLALPSQINLTGHIIHMEHDAMLVAPNADVTFKAGSWNYVPSTPSSTFIYNGGQVYIDKNALINVAGTAGSEAPLADNIVTLQLRGSEFSNSPLNRNNAGVRGVDITLDLRQQGVYNGFAWAGTPLADATGYVGIVQRDVGQLTGAGGTVNINSGGSVVVQNGAVIDVSGGYVQYGAGMVKTTRLIYQGHIFDISQATPDRVYDGIYTGTSTFTHSRWGITKTYTAPFMLGEHFEHSYTYGFNGGAINISAPSMALDGTMRGNTVNGPRQRDQQAAPSSLSLAFEAQKVNGTQVVTYSPTPPKVVFQNGVTQQVASDFNASNLSLRDDRVKKVVLSPDALKEGGFGSVSVKNVDGNITVAEGNTLDLGPRGSLTLSGANIDVEGSIVAPGGGVTLNAYNISPLIALELGSTDGASLPNANAGRGLITLGSSGSITTAGLIVDDRLSAPHPFELPIAITGGSVSLNAFSANLSGGSVIDVSGGVRVDPFGKRTYGDGGGISIATGRDLTLNSVIGGKLTLDGTLRGSAGMGARGGALSLQALQVQVGGSTINKDTLLLQPDFFSTGGFSQFSLTGIKGLSIAPNTIIDPVVHNTVAVLYGDDRDMAVMRDVVLPEGLRSPLSLTFNALGSTNSFANNKIIAIGNVVLGDGAVIKAGPLGSVSFKGDTVALFGSVFAPGGVINVTGASKYPSDSELTNALTTVYIGPHSTLSTAGTVVLTPDAYGRRTGYILPGGAINVVGNIVAERGSLLDVSGASGDLDIAPALLGDTPGVLTSSGLTTPQFAFAVERTTIDSSGGSIVLKGSQMLFTHATLHGEAGGPTAAGGTLSISSGRFYQTGATQLPTDITLDVTQNGGDVPSTFFAPGTSGIGKGIDISGKPAQGYFAINDFSAGGFDSLSLGGSVKFKGPITINAAGSLQVATSGFLTADAAVNLSAGYVAIGQPFAGPLSPTQNQNPFSQGTNPFFFAPTFGPGSLNITADVIDIGNLTLGNIGNVRMNARHDIRGDGTFSLTGDLFMRAGQIYPVTGTSFTIAAYDSPGHTGSITFARNGTESLPLSAGGTLNVYASTITQGGVLRAPFGVINLGWDGTGTAPTNLAVGTTLPMPVTKQLTLTSGSITSVSAIDPITGQGILIPYGFSPNGTNWIDPAGTDITASGPPQKKITIAGQSVTTDAGSVIDLRGGGDLYAYRWVTGLMGSHDILANSNVFAVIPGFNADFSPFGAFNNMAIFNGDHGYVNSTLRPGDHIYLDSGSGLRAGNYTLLPARYAMMPGAFLITPQSGNPIGTFLMPDGATYVNGYRFNSFGSGGEPVKYGRYEIAPASTLSQRAQYDSFFANSFFEDYATQHHLNVPRLPEDSGQLVFTATSAMTLNGNVLMKPTSGGRGGFIDISSPVDIVIQAPGDTAQSGKLNLNASQLSAFGADSLLIGGVRTIGTNGTTVAVNTNNLTVNTHGTALSGPEIILVANKQLTVETLSEIKQIGTLSSPSENLIINGDGTLIRVSSDASAAISRTNLSGTATTPLLTINAASIIGGNSVILDSTYGTKLDAIASINAKALTLDSGQISIQLGGAGNLVKQPQFGNKTTPGLVIGLSLLDTLNKVNSLSLLSYSTIDIYGSGNIGDAGMKNLSLHAGEIRGFNTGGDTTTFTAQNITIDNSANGRVFGVLSNPPKGTLAFEAQTLHIGANKTQLDQYANLTLTASKGLYLDGNGGLAMTGNITANTPFISASRSATQSITAGGALVINSTSGTGSVASGLGASVTLQGSNATVNSDIILPSGRLTIIATNGNVDVGGTLNVGGTAQTFFDLTKYTDAGTITLSSATGSVNVTGTLDISAPTGGGQAGTLAVNAAQGSFGMTGTLNGAGGSFALDVKSLPTFSALATTLASAGINDALSFRVRTGDVLIDGITTAHSFTLSADAGKVDVSGTITAHDINLIAFKGLTVASGSLLDASAVNYDSAGKGGSISLETRGNSSGTINIATGSRIELGVVATAEAGQFSGTLHLRAPQNTGATDLFIDTINGTINGASSIVAEGFKVYDISSSSTLLSNNKLLSTSNPADATTLFGNGTIFGSNTTAIANRLLVGNNTLSIQVGAEVISSGNITLGLIDAANNSKAWDLSAFRFGTKNTPGVLTLRAAGDIVLYEAISDGFQGAAFDANLLANNASLSANAQSWSYRITAGADLNAADVHQLNTTGLGSLKIGRDAGTGNTTGKVGDNVTVAQVVKDHFQVIRTGSGNIEISAAHDVQLLNQFATIYTAGTQVADATMGGTFDVPKPTFGTDAVPIPGYTPQFTQAGGNITINAGNDIKHTNFDGTPDSSRQLPNNWLYRRGFTEDGTFGVSKFGEITSTAWWVDFSNFFQGIGALGGGNVTLNAKNDVTNVDAVIPTNARMSKDGTNFVELGGGDLRITTGRNLDAGAYYVERGRGTLNVGGSIITNATRVPAYKKAAFYTQETWLPTTLFVGKSSFDVSARGDALLGPMANVFFLPQGANNSVWYKTYFSTYSGTSAVNISSLSGSVTMREAIAPPSELSTGAGDVTQSTPILNAWMDNVQRYNASGTDSASFVHPWLRLAETSLTQFNTITSVMPSSLRITSFGGDVNLIGNLTLNPSPTGTLDIAASGAVNGLQINGVTKLTSSGLVNTWSASRINVSDADPAALPGIRSPYAYQSIVGLTNAATNSNALLLDIINKQFAESGSTEGDYGVLQTKQALHAQGVLHANDANPVHLYAAGGDISGVTLFSPKAARIVASEDITDIAFYIQNTKVSDVSVVASGGDIIAYDSSSPLRTLSGRAGNKVSIGEVPLAGDIQISGPGTLEVLAGRNLDLGSGGNNADGTGVGITSIGNGRNPSLPFNGANIIAAAGIGSAFDLSSSALDFDAFMNSIGTGTGAGGHDYFTELGDPKIKTLADYKKLSDEEQKRIALSLFFLVLRDAGRDHNIAGTPGFGNYAAGQAAVTTLFKGSAWSGDITTQARDIRTKSGGGITLLAPGGGLTLADSVIGTPLAPPGIITEGGGNINIFTNTDVNIGISRIFTLRGGDEVIWSNTGNIAAGSSSKTVQSAPPTRVIIDPQSGDVKTDLAGLATGGGIGVLATVVGVAPGSVDLIAPLGAIDAGDAGIRSTGNLNIAAVTVLNASNISVGGASAGAPAAPAAAAPAVSVSTPSSNPNQGGDVAKQQAEQERKKAVDQQQQNTEDLPSIVTVEIIGYGGGEGEDEDDEDELKKKRKAQ